jgi:hypothetical protein
MVLTNKKQYDNTNETIIVYEYERCLYVAHLYCKEGNFVSNMYTIELEAIMSVLEEKLMGVYEIN